MRARREGAGQVGTACVSGPVGGLLLKGGLPEVIALLQVRLQAHAAGVSARVSRPHCGPVPRTGKGDRP